MSDVADDVPVPWTHAERAFVAFFFQSLGLDAVGEHLFPRSQQLDRRLQLPRGLFNHLAQGINAFRGLPEPKDLGSTRGAVNAVNHIIKVARQQMDVFTIEGGNERAVQSTHDFVRNLVGFILKPLDGLNAIPSPTRGTGQ